MDAGELRRCCLGHGGAIEDFPFGPEHSVFKVAGKMFALSALDRTPLEVSVKCDPELAVELRNSYAAIRPGYHLNTRHWNTITIDGTIDGRLVRDMIEDSYVSSSARSPNAFARSSAGLPDDGLERGGVPDGESRRCQDAVDHRPATTSAPIACRFRSTTGIVWPRMSVGLNSTISAPA